MATTNIKLDIENITGIGSGNADAQFIISAQKFIISSIPKDLLTFAQKVSSSSTDGSAISFSVNDSIIDVQRNGFSCKEIPPSDSIWALDSESLKYATAKYPTWYHKQGAIHFAPVTDGSNAGYLFYVDYSLIDDDCDLRNAVIYRASASEFTKLATDLVPSWTSPALPVAPISPNFGSDLTISSSAPVKPVIIKASVDTSGMTEPGYTKPTIVLRPAPIISNLSISAVSPASIGTPSFTAPDISAIFNPASSPPSYVAPVLILSSTPVISDLSISAIPPVPPAAPSFSTPAIGAITVASTTLTSVSNVPIYTPPVIGGDALELSSLDDLDADNTIDTLADQPEWDQWFATAAHLIEDEEDTELAQVQLQKISTYIQAYSGAMQNQLNIFNDANAEYQGKLQEAIQQAQLNAQKAAAQGQIDATDAQQEANLLLQKQNQEYAASIQKFGGEVQQYQANVASEVQEYQQNLAADIQVWQAERTTDLQKYGTDIQNSLNNFNKENIEYQAQLQQAIQEAGLVLQKENQEYVAKLQKFGSDIQNYQADVAKEVQEYQQNLAADLQVWQAERTTDIQKYNSDIQNEQAEFNKELQIYQAELQVAIQDAQLDSSEDDQKLQKYSAELQEYQHEINKELQDYTNTLAKEVQEYQNKVTKYGAELQSYQAEIAEQSAEKAVAQQSIAYYSQQSDKYYNWSQMEVTQYIQNNTKIIKTGLAAQTAQKRR